MAQKVFEGDVVFSILIDREKSTNKNREQNISFEDFLDHLRDPRVRVLLISYCWKRFFFQLNPETLEKVPSLRKFYNPFL